MLDRFWLLVQNFEKQQIANKYLINKNSLNCPHIYYHLLSGTLLSAGDMLWTKLTSLSDLVELPSKSMGQDDKQK